jgi:hypothetical protein
MLTFILRQFGGKFILSSLILLLVASTVAYVVRYGLAIMAEMVLLALDIFSSVGMTLRNYVWLLVIWMFIFCTVKKVPFQSIALKSMANILIE